MNKITITINSFIKRGGHYIFSSSIFSKLAGFILSIVIVRILSEESFGNISYALSVMMILVPLSGMGLHHSLLRFGAIETSSSKKNKLFIAFAKYGVVASFLMIIILILLSKIITIQLPESQKYLLLFSPLLLTFFISELLFSYFRAQKNNKYYSLGMFLKAILLLVVCVTLSLTIGGSGYVIGYVVVPLLVSLYMFYKGRKFYELGNDAEESVHMPEYIKYGLWVGIGTIASKLVVMLDVIMVGNIIADSTQVAIYKVATIIPMNLIFIPALLLRTDYVYIAEKYLNKRFLIGYYKKYLLIFFVILLVIFLIWLLFSNAILSVFGPNYTSAKPIIGVLLIMLIGSFLFRIPLGNILAAVGKSKWNSISNMALVVENIILNLIMIPKYGIIGAAIATTLSIWTSGIIDIGLFIYYLKKYCV